MPKKSKSDHEKFANTQVCTPIPASRTRKQKSETEFSKDEVATLLQTPIAKDLLMELVNVSGNAFEQHKKKCRESRLNQNKRLSTFITPSVQMRRVNRELWLAKEYKEIGKAELLFHERLEHVVAYVDVWCLGIDRSAEVKKLMVAMGARIQNTINAIVSHVVFQEGSDDTFKNGISNGSHIVSVHWLRAAKRSAVRVPEILFNPLKRHADSNLISEICEVKDEVVPSEDGSRLGRVYKANVNSPFEKKDYKLEFINGSVQKIKINNKDEDKSICRKLFCDKDETDLDVCQITSENLKPISSKENGNEIIPININSTPIKARDTIPKVISNVNKRTTQKVTFTEVSENGLFRRKNSLNADTLRSIKEETISLIKRIKDIPSTTPETEMFVAPLLSHKQKNEITNGNNENAISVRPISLTSSTKTRPTFNVGRTADSVRNDNLEMSGISPIIKRRKLTVPPTNNEKMPIKDCSLKTPKLKIDKPVRCSTARRSNENGQLTYSRSTKNTPKARSSSKIKRVTEPPPFTLPGILNTQDALTNISENSLIKEKIRLNALHSIKEKSISLVKRIKDIHDSTSTEVEMFVAPMLSHDETIEIADGNNENAVSVKPFSSTDILTTPENKSFSSLRINDSRGNLKEERKLECDKENKKPLYRQLYNPMNRSHNWDNQSYAFPCFSPCGTPESTRRKSTTKRCKSSKK